MTLLFLIILILSTECIYAFDIKNHVQFENEVRLRRKIQKY